MWRNNCAITKTSSKIGTLEKIKVPSTNKVVAIKTKTLFFAPSTDTDPFSGLELWTIINSLFIDFYPKYLIKRLAVITNFVMFKMI